MIFLVGHKIEIGGNQREPIKMRYMYMVNEICIEKSGS
jgi:hypothetical protein